MRAETTAVPRQRLALAALAAGFALALFFLFFSSPAGAQTSTGGSGNSGNTGGAAATGGAGSGGNSGGGADAGSG
ncbi:MAG: hypothetical protein ACRD12_06775, partial [Acidimicrobiales bacterium]